MAGTIHTTTLGDGKTRSYRARYRDASGRQHERRFRRKVDAQAWLDGQTSALVTQTWTAPERGRVLVGEWARSWMDAQTGLKESTRYRYGTLLNARVLPAWGTHRLADVTYADVAKWVASMSAPKDKGGAGLRPSSVRQAHRVFALILEHAVRDGRLPRNPAKGVPLPRTTRAEARFLTRDEVERLATAAGDYADTIRLLAYTGLRFGEMAALRVRRVDFLRRRITVAESATEVGGVVAFGTPKTHQERTVSVPRFLVDALARRCEGKSPDDFVMASPDGSVLRSSNFRRRVFDPAVRVADLPGLTPHDLRHTAASLLVASGADVKAVQRMLGHASAAMTLDVYAGLFDDNLGALADRMDADHAAHVAEAAVGTVWAPEPTPIQHADPAAV